MENKNTPLDNLVQQSNPLDFGLVIEKSFENFKKIALLAGVSILLLVFILFGVLFVAITSFMGATDNLTDTLTNFNMANLSIVSLLIYVLVMIVIAGITAPIGAGFLRMAHLAQENKPFSIGTIFDYYKTHHFKELFVAGSLISIVSMGLSAVFETIDLSIAGSILTYVIGFFTFLTVPLIIFGNQTAINAITKSIQLILKQPFVIFGLLVVGFIGIFVGLIGLCIGIFFTLPFWYSLTYTIYIHLLPIKETSEIEEIGADIE